MFDEKCKVRVLLDQKNARAGDILTGKVLVFIEESIECRGMYLKIQSSVKGRGTPIYKDHDIEKLYEGYFNKGEEHIFDFRMTVPDGEPTVYGTLINRIWLVTAEIDLKWAFDPHGEQDFILLPSKEKVEREINLKQINDYSVGNELFTTSIVVFILAAFFGICLLFLFQFLTFFGIHLSMDIIFPITAVLGIVVFILLIPNIRRVTQFGPLKISLSDRYNFMGDKVEVDMILSPQKNWNCSTLTFTFFIEEWIMYKQGTKTRQKTERIVETVIHTESDIELEKNKDNVFTTSFELPTDFSPSMNYDRNEVRWGIEVESVDTNDNRVVTCAYFWVGYTPEQADRLISNQ